MGLQDVDWINTAECGALYFGSCYNGADLSDSERDGGKHECLHEHYSLKFVTNISGNHVPPTKKINALWIECLIANTFCMKIKNANLFVFCIFLLPVWYSLLWIDLNKWYFIVKTPWKKKPLYLHSQDITFLTKALKISEEPFMFFFYYCVFPYFSDIVSSLWYIRFGMCDGNKNITRCGRNILHHTEITCSEISTSIYKL